MRFLIPGFFSVVPKHIYTYTPGSFSVLPGGYLHGYLSESISNAVSVEWDVTNYTDTDIPLSQYPYWLFCSCCFLMHLMCPCFIFTHINTSERSNRIILLWCCFFWDIHGLKIALYTIFRVRE